MFKRYTYNNLICKNVVRCLVSFIALSGITATAQETLSPALVDPYEKVNSAYNNTLDNIDFNRNANGGAETKLTLSAGTVKPQLIEAKGKVTLTLPATALAEDQYVELDVVNFATPVSKIETFQEETASKVVFTYSGNVSARFIQSDNEILVSITEINREIEQQALEQDAYTGSPISLDFQDVPVRQVLQIIAQVNGFNLVTTDTVSGNITISLSAVPWDQALDMILQIKGLGKRLQGNILLIAPAEELTARETQELEAKQQVAELESLRTTTITVNYAKAIDLANILSSEDGGILSGRGSVTVDERTNTILLRDTLESIDGARAMVELLDVPVKQVLIESRMVTVNDSVDEELGVRWGFTGQQDDFATSGSLIGADTANTGLVGDLDNRLNVNLPVTNENAGFLAFQVASLANGTILDLELSALEAENKGEIIASPRITVANQQEAYIEQGTEIPFVSAASSGATAVEFKKAVLSLLVTPQITPDNRIILDLVVTQDTQGDTVSTSTGNAIAINTQELRTQVLVENGQTVVLGGIFQQITTSDVNKIPLFGDLPVVGALFRNSSNTVEKRELLIFVTPKIMTESL
ncbi:type IV pilus secretin PilQ family protein [Alteromonas sp. 5E99-2]|uniref:type IV pilus secretin PilQ n=1 Tax=Alteromonas sp. 5E99-2 TaxID=2817683 RepID=UPI001A995525|nr:type IV pilus secretin PilQ family protein [Alteromonas sp. 5E99-2]MBO1254636.1 type IV pilus secretin PilQ family protein [Alteromonas sp. 5E99-2]